MESLITPLFENLDFVNCIVIETNKDESKVHMRFQNLLVEDSLNFKLPGKFEIAEGKLVFADVLEMQHTENPSRPLNPVQVPVGYKEFQFYASTPFDHLTFLQADYSVVARSFFIEPTLESLEKIEEEIFLSNLLAKYTSEKGFKVEHFYPNSHSWEIHIKHPKIGWVYIVISSLFKKCHVHATRVIRKNYLVGTYFIAKDNLPIEANIIVENLDLVLQKTMNSRWWLMKWEIPEYKMDAIFEKEAL